MADQAVGDIIKAISDDVKLLVRDEVELAKSELMPAAKDAGLAGGMFGAAGYFAICALSLFYFAAAFGLVQLGLEPWLAFLIVGAALLLIAGILGLVGYTRVKKVKAPEATIASAQQAVDELRTAATRAVAAANAPQIEGKVVQQRALR